MAILPSGALELEQVQLIDQVDITSISWIQSVIQSIRLSAKYLRTLKRNDPAR